MSVWVITPLCLLATLSLIPNAGCSSQAPASATPSDLPALFFAADEVPWVELENGWRRKALFSGELTLVVFEAKGPTTGPIELHSHVHDQISYVAEGEIEAQVGNETRLVSTGGFFRVPANSPHGVRVLSPKLVAIDAFTPPREDFR